MNPISHSTHARELLAKSGIDFQVRFPQATFHIMFAGGIEIQENSILGRGAEPNHAGEIVS